MLKSKSIFIILLLSIVLVISGAKCPWDKDDDDDIIVTSSGEQSPPDSGSSGGPDAPSGLIASMITSSRIDLSWIDISNDEYGFKIERRTVPTDTAYTQIAAVGTNVTSYSNTTGFTDDTTYYYRVRAYNANGNSSYSNEAWNSTDTWTWTATSMAAPPSERWRHTAIWTGTKMVTWGGSFAGDGAKYYPITDTWDTGVSMVDAPSGRSSHTAVWTNTEMLIWGGVTISDEVNTGARYDPSLNSWTVITTTNVPKGRSGHTAVWTDTEMIVWGGYGYYEIVGQGYLDTGGKYNPITDVWAPITTTNAPSPRTGHTAIWTGNEMIVWGGSTASSTVFNTGAKYYPITDTWVSISTLNAPSARSAHTVIWTGEEMIVWGGWAGIGNYFNDGAKYNPSTDTWTPITITSAPSSRRAHTAIWTGNEMIVWGGVWDDDELPLYTYLNTGGRYNPTNDTWITITQTGLPTKRAVSSSIWTGTEMIIWGGYDGSDLNTGGRYKP